MNSNTLMTEVTCFIQVLMFFFQGRLSLEASILQISQFFTSTYLFTAEHLPPAAILSGLIYTIQCRVRCLSSLVRILPACIVSFVFEVPKPPLGRRTPDRGLPLCRGG